MLRGSNTGDETRQQLNVLAAEREWKPLPQSKWWPGRHKEQVRKEGVHGDEH